MGPLRLVKRDYIMFFRTANLNSKLKNKYDFSFCLLMTKQSFFVGTKQSFFVGTKIVH
jgi:hypothetical protein